MAQGVGQFAGEFSSPDFPDLGVATWDQMSGLQVDNPYVAGPVSGGFAPDTGDATGLVHLAAGDTPAEHSGVQHYSELWNLNSPLPWFLGLALMFFGLVSLSVNARVGK